MDGMKKWKNWQSILTKYRYPAIVLLIGILILLIPGRDAEQKSDILEQMSTESLEERLEKILATMEGAGKVDVLLSVGEGEKTIYQSDLQSNQSDDSDSVNSKTIVITDSQRVERGLVQQTNPPEYLGAVISCQGADDPLVRLAIVDAVSTSTGLGADKISVMKMK